MKNVLGVLPRLEHRITLSSQKDAMGLPKPQAHIECLRRRDSGGPDLALLARAGLAAGAVALILILIGLYVYRRRRARVVAGRSRPKR